MTMPQMREFHAVSVMVRAQARCPAPQARTVRGLRGSSKSAGRMTVVSDG